MVGGKQQISEPTKATPKNVGRKNATTGAEQARNEAESLFVHKLERKYSRTPEEAAEPLNLPMLAHSFDDKKRKKTVYPVHVQPKLDGFRCLATREGNEIRMISRAGKPFHLPHLERALLSFLPDQTTVDGELYKHGVDFQTIASWIKKARPETSQIQYNLYDVPEWKGTEGQVWQERYRDLVDIDALNFTESITLVKTYAARSEEHVLQLEMQFVEEGYEGAIVRYLEGIYHYGYRSHELLKVKTFQDSEAVVVDVVGGDGKFAECGIFVCRDAEGREFRAVSRGTMLQRADYLKNRQEYIGEMLKYKYFGLTNEGKPRHAVGLGIRPKFDLPTH